MKKFMIMISVVMLLAVVMFAFGPAIVAHANGEDYANNPGLANASACGQQHGAFQAFEGLRGSWIPEAAQLGGIGDTTGSANSAKGCQANNP